MMVGKNCKGFCSVLRQVHVALATSLELPLQTRLVSTFRYYRCKQSGQALQIILFFKCVRYKGGGITRWVAVGIIAKSLPNNSALANHAISF